MVMKLLIHKKVVIFFWVAVLSLSFFHHHQSVKKEALSSHFLSSRYKKVVILKDERWDFSWKDQILYFIVIFIIFSFLITVITKKYNDYMYDQDENGTIRFLTRLRYKNLFPSEVELGKKSNFENYKVLIGGGRKRNLFGCQGRCFLIEFFIYFVFFYNVFFFFLDLFIFPVIRAFFRKKKEENLMDCVERINENKFYLSEDGIEIPFLSFFNPIVVYILYRCLAFLVLRICCFFDQTLEAKMLAMANEEGKKITKENLLFRQENEKRLLHAQEKNKNKKPQEKKCLDLLCSSAN